MQPPDPDHWPRFCCAILRDARGRYLLERRPPHKAAAPGMVTCFGGGRWPGEHPDDCIRRELREELGHEQGPVRHALKLVGTGERVIAWFYRGPDPSEFRTEPGVEAVLAEWEQMVSLPVSGWHLAALRAERVGKTEARVEG